MPEQKTEDKTSGTKNETVKIAVDEITKENVMLKDTVAKLTAERDELKIHLDETTALIESQVRAKLSGELQHISRFSVEDIDHMETEQLQMMVNTLEHSANIKKPLVPGKPEADAEDPRMTVGNLFGQPLRTKAEAS
jgi:hypothetical protein